MKKSPTALAALSALAVAVSCGAAPDISLAADASTISIGQFVLVENEAAKQAEPDAATNSAGKDVATDSDDKDHDGADKNVDSRSEKQPETMQEK